MSCPYLISCTRTVYKNQNQNIELVITCALLKKGKIEKGYEHRFREEIFEVHTVIPHEEPLYLLQEENGEKLKENFYETELSLVRGMPNKKFHIDKVIKGKGNKVLLRWLGYSKHYDSWIMKSQL